MENKMVFWFVVRVIGITTLLIGLYVLLNRPGHGGKHHG